MTTRTINVTGGAAEYVTARLTEVFDEDITGATFSVGLGGYETPPTTWKVPNEIEFEGTSAALVSLLVDNTFTPRRKAYLWVKLLDTPEVLMRRASGADLTIV